MDDPRDTTVELLNAWYGGDAEALQELLGDNVDWMRGFVRKKQSGKHRRRFDSIDVVQDAVVRLLEKGPRYAPRNRAQFRALVAKVLDGALGDQLDRAHAVKRDVARDEALPSKALSRFHPAGHERPSPASVAAQRERREAVREAIERLAPDDREVLLLRQIEELPFEEVARRLGLASADAARMRYQRALPRLARILPAPDEPEQGS